MKFGISLRKNQINEINEIDLYEKNIYSHPRGYKIFTEEGSDIIKCQNVKCKGYCDILNVCVIIETIDMIPQKKKSYWIRKQQQF